MAKTVLMVLMVQGLTHDAWAGVDRPGRGTTGTPVAIFRVPMSKYYWDESYTYAPTVQAASRKVRKWLASIGATEVK